MVYDDFDVEFHKRVKHNFKVYVLLTSKSINWKEDAILGSIYQMKGYKCHKTVKYEMKTSHIHLKFEDENLAKEAVGYLNNLSTDLAAVLVDDMLRDWFRYEKRSACSPPWTLTVVDIIGNPPLSLNFLTENILKSILQDFGDPYLLPYTAALNEPHVQILFGSMTEALAACMAFGEWCNRYGKIDSFFYRVRINPSDKEAILVKNSGGFPAEAFKLDYFVSLRNEIYRKQQKTDEPETKKIPRVKSSQTKVIPPKNRKQKFVPFNADSKDNSTAFNVGRRTPILCVPVITPLNSYAEALRATSKHLNVDFTNAILNIQQTCQVANKSIVETLDSESDDNSLQKSSEDIFSGNDTLSLVSLDTALTVKQSSDYHKMPEKIPDTTVLISPKKRFVTKQKSGHKRNTRVFEHRK